MAKFIMTLGNESFNVLVDEAKQRDVTVQQFLRAVVVPDWIKENLLDENTKQDLKSVLVSPAARLRQ